MSRLSINGSGGVFQGLWSRSGTTHLKTEYPVNLEDRGKQRMLSSSDREGAQEEPRFKVKEGSTPCLRWQHSSQTLSTSRRQERSEMVQGSPQSSSDEVSKQLFESGWAEMVPVGFVSNPARFCCSHPNHFQSSPGLLYIYFNAEAVALSSSCSLCRIIIKTLARLWLTFPLPMSTIAFWKEFSAFSNVAIHKIWGPRGVQMAVTQPCNRLFGGLLAAC